MGNVEKLAVGVFLPPGNVITDYKPKPHPKPFSELRLHLCNCCPGVIPNTLVDVHQFRSVAFVLGIKADAFTLEFGFGYQRPTALAGYAPGAYRKFFDEYHPAK